MTSHNKKNDSETKLTYWRSVYKGARVTFSEDGERASVRTLRRDDSSKISNNYWLDFIPARGQIITIGDFEPCIIQDYTSRSLMEWMQRISCDFQSSPSYAMDKMAQGMSGWWGCLVNHSTLLHDMTLAIQEAKDYIEEYPSEDGDTEDTLESLEAANTIEELREIMYEYDQDSAEYSFGAVHPDCLWRMVAAAEVVIAARPAWERAQRVRKLKKPRGGLNKNHNRHKLNRVR